MKTAMRSWLFGWLVEDEREISDIVVIRIVSGSKICSTPDPGPRVPRPRPGAALTQIVWRGLMWEEGINQIRITRNSKLILQPQASIIYLHTSLSQFDCAVAFSLSNKLEK